MKVKVVEDLIQYAIVVHTFGPTNVMEYFPEEVLPLGKNMLLEVDNLVGYESIELIGMKWPSKLFLSCLL